MRVYGSVDAHTSFWSGSGMRAVAGPSCTPPRKGRPGKGKLFDSADRTGPLPPTPEACGYGRNGVISCLIVRSRVPGATKSRFHAAQPSTRDGYIGIRPAYPAAYSSSTGASGTTSCRNTPWYGTATIAASIQGHGSSRGQAVIRGAYPALLLSAPCQRCTSAFPVRSNQSVGRLHSGLPTVSAFPGCVSPPPPHLHRWIASVCRPSCNTPRPRVGPNTGMPP